METPSQFLLTIGGILLLGLFTSTLAQRTFLPRVTLLLLFGAMIGQEGFDIIPRLFTDHFELIADMTLLMVGFLLGGKLTRDYLNVQAKRIIWISISDAAITSITVALVLLLFNTPLEIAILLGCIASATAPAAVLDVVNESQTDNRFTQKLLGIVTLDDIWALMLFGLGIAVVTSLNGTESNHSVTLMLAQEIGGGILLGLVIGFPAAYLTGRIKAGEPMLAEALGIVFVCGGLAIWLDVSFLIASIAMGAVIANFASHHDYPFHAIEGIEWPFMAVFFVLAGASLELAALQDIGWIGVIYLLSRAMGKFVGTRIGCQLSHASQIDKNWIGVALLPQAGVAIGIALVASNQFPEYRQMLLSLVVSTTVIFEIIGPVFTRLAIKKSLDQP